MRRCAPLLISVLMSACDAPHSALAPQGEAAALIARLWWVLLAVAVVVTIASIAALLMAIYHKRGAWQPPTPESDRVPTRWIVIGGVIAPAFIVIFLLVFTLITLGALAPTQAARITVNITGAQWWWDVQYQFPEQHRNVRTANEVHIPTGERVVLLLESRDVIHSFWVPGLHGKMDLVPGKRNRIWIEADQPGIYRGQCAEYCGVQHAHMAIYVVAHDPAEFERWLEQQRLAGASPRSPQATQGQQVFLRTGCVLCHTIRGTSALATIGPDLTHVGSRMTLAAGTIPNTRGHMGGWISNPQQIKPGNHMPRVPLSAEELQSLLVYLEGLK